MQEQNQPLTKLREIVPNPRPQKRVIMTPPHTQARSPDRQLQRRIIPAVRRGSAPIHRHSCKFAQSPVARLENTPNSPVPKRPPPPCPVTRETTISNKPLSRPQVQSK